jgi:hypothetical protein
MENTESPDTHIPHREPGVGTTRLVYVLDSLLQTDNPVGGGARHCGIMRVAAETAFSSK